MRNDNNQGACVARNMGIFKATGEFITGLDDDDEFTSNRIRFLLIIGVMNYLLFVVIL